MTSSGIETATFQLVAYCLNQLCYQGKTLNQGILNGGSSVYSSEAFDEIE
jgi:hypothetical protein